MLTLPPSVKIYVSVQPVDARKSFDGLAALVEAEFGLEPMSGHLFVFLNRRGHVAQLLVLLGAAAGGGGQALEERPVGLAVAL